MNGIARFHRSLSFLHRPQGLIPTAWVIFATTSPMPRASHPIGYSPVPNLGPSGWGQYIASWWAWTSLPSTAQGQKPPQGPWPWGHREQATTGFMRNRLA